MSAAAWRRASGARPHVYGHRGVRGERTENTMPAFERAADLGADGVELDVRLCGSGEIVVHHDEDLARTTGGRDTRAVAALAWGELAQVELEDGDRVPQLREVLAWARDARMRVNVEIKRDVPDRGALVRAVARVLAAQPEADAWLLVSSFDPALVAYFAWLVPRIPCGLLVEAERPWLAAGWPAALVRADAVHPEASLVTPARLARWHAAGRAVNVWTVDDPTTMERLAALGVDGIVTDVPGLARQVLG